MKVWRFKRALADIVCDEGRVNGSGVRARERGESTTYYLVENQPRTAVSRRGGGIERKGMRGRTARPIKKGKCSKGLVVFGFSLDNEGHPGGPPRYPKVSETKMSEISYLEQWHTYSKQWANLQQQPVTSK